MPISCTSPSLCYLCWTEVVAHFFQVPLLRLMSIRVKLIEPGDLCCPTDIYLVHGEPLVTTIFWTSETT